MSKKREIFILILISLFSFHTTFASTYFSDILSEIGISRNQNPQLNPTKISNFGFLNNIFRSFTQTNANSSLQVKTPNANIQIQSSDTNAGQVVSAKVETPTKSVELNLNTSTTANPNTYLNSILGKLGITPKPNVNPLTQIGTTNPSTQNQNTNPFLNNGQANPNSVLGNIMAQPNFAGNINSAMGPGGQMFGGGGMGSFIQNVMSGNPEKALGDFAKQNGLPQPYFGPGGTTAGDCGIPKGPMAYNIGGSGGDGVRCDAKTVFVGKEQSLKSGIFGGGYINPLVQNDGKCKYSGATKKSIQSGKYGEDQATDYNSQEAKAYVDCQIMHWKAEAAKVGQSCIPVDIDNCDAIGADNYKKILDRVEELNSGGAKVKVMIKNPHLGACNYFSHPAVVGAFVESASEEDAKKVVSERNKPEQILLFARGGTGSNLNLKKIENLKIPNSAYSYDSGGEYKNITNCTYNP